MSAPTLFSRLLPYLFYAAGSACFLVGTVIVIVREVKR